MAIIAVSGPPAEKSSIENSWSAICKQGLLAGGLVAASTYNVFGDPLIAIIAVVVHFVFYAFSQIRGNEDWFDLSVAKEKLKKALWVIPPFLGINLAFAYLMRVVANASGAHQISLRVLVRAFLERNPIKFSWVFSNIIFFSAFAEEIFFRGFVQEKIRDIEVFICKDYADTTICKVVRVVLQALIFSACHFRAQQGLSNIALLGITFLFGCWFGAEKERGTEKLAISVKEPLAHDNTLWKTVFIHISWNFLVCLRVLVFKV